MKRIPLWNRAKEIIAYTLIDDEDFERVNEFRWNKGKLNSVQRTIWIGEKHFTIMLHRFIMECPKNKVVDHINGNPLDNRKSNLRICTLQQNTCNTKLYINNTTGYKGINWNKRQKNWIAKIIFSINGKRRTKQKQFVNIEDAVNFYAELSKAYHGEFGRLK